MNCIEARQAMLDAELPELRPRSESPLGLHLRQCGACRALAAALSRDTDALSSQVRARDTRRMFSLAALPVAAGLIVTVTVLAARSDRSRAIAQPHADRPANVVSVDVGVGQRAAVIKTADPNTTLIWISSGSH